MIFLLSKIGCRFSFLFVLFLSTAFFANGNPKTPSWGKLTKEEIALEEVPYEQEAHAVVLFNTGELSYFNSNFKIQRHFRIKILDNEGLSHGDVVIPYYSKDGTESIKNIKAQTHEILPNGKTIAHKLNKQEIYDVAVNENWNEIRFPMPAVKAGTIIECSYTVYTTNFTFLDAWVFQDEIPTLYSSFKAEIPHFLSYITLMQGPKIYQKYKNLEPTNLWELENLPALKAEPFTYNLGDYAEKIQFQLSSYKIRDRNGYESDKKVFTDWMAISNKVLSHESFKPFLKQNKLPDELTSKIPAGRESLATAKELYAYVQQHFSWNEKHGLVPDKSWKEFLNEKAGNGAAINLLLVNLLQKAGIDASAVAISTKHHGKVSENFPFVSQFNHVIAMVKIKEDTYLVDAAGNSLPFGILPVKDLNLKGLILSEEKTEWVEIKDQSNSSTFISNFIDLSSGLYVSEGMWSGFNGLEAAREIRKEKYSPFLLTTNNSLLPDSTQIVDSLSVSNTLKCKLYFSEKDWKGFTAPRVYYQLSMPEDLQESPLKGKNRTLPLDFGYSFRNYYNYQLLLPEGYQLEEQPESLLLRTPDNQAIFSYQAIPNGKELNIQIRMEIRNNFFSVHQYHYLREFFDKAVNHCQQAIVLSRTDQAEN